MKLCLCLLVLILIKQEKSGLLLGIIKMIGNNIYVTGLLKRRKKQNSLPHYNFPNWIRLDRGRNSELGLR